ncbi:MAG: ribonuclease HII [Oscillospiraceae bacterium]|nr:ribonuclease HII [Oscillospiraceae bacterium]
MEAALHEQGLSLVCGVDEAGRGPLAGPVCAAAVILPMGCELPGLNDSKKLTEKQRERLFPLIQEQAIAYGIAFASVEEIESMNILSAALLAMNRAIEQLSPAPDMALIDGNTTRDIKIPAQSVVGGDGKCACIAAASVLAKVTRDRLMTELAVQYPQYGFEKHKGYGTRAHYAALDEYGPCPAHRMSFLKKYYAKR